jgi:hypothetical protein
MGEPMSQRGEALILGNAGLALLPGLVGTAGLH